MTRVAARGADRFANPNSLVTRARPVVPVSGSGSNTINVGGVGRVGCAIRLGLHPAASRTTTIVTRNADDLAVDMHGLRSEYDYGSTRTATVVPRTPTIAAGVSRRMESGASFAMRPDTYAATPRTNFRTIPIPPSPGAYT